jgi:hypothetical protein
MDVTRFSGIVAAELQLAAREMRRPWTSTQWREYFRRNARSLMKISWGLGVPLTEAERQTIAASVQQFQLGESSDGHHFMLLASRYADASGDRHYLPALRRFIAEEQRHGRDLGRVLDLAGVPRLESCFVDTVFRWLRHRAGLELSISILVTAEIIAQVYYAALRDATGSRVIRRLCDQILRDEDEHVRFQCERLAIIRHRQWRAPVAIKRLAHRAFFTGTCGVFWLKHARVMRAGGYGLVAFWRAARRQLRIAMRLMDSQRYDFSNSVGSARADADRRPHVAPPNANAKLPPAQVAPASQDLDLRGKWLEL